MFRSIKKEHKVEFLDTPIPRDTDTDRIAWNLNLLTRREVSPEASVQSPERARGPFDKLRAGEKESVIANRKPREAIYNRER